MAFSPFGRNLKRAIISDHIVTKFFGNNTEVDDIKTTPDGSSPDSLNWITGTEQDQISLRRGTSLLGKTRNSGAGAITGLGIGTRLDGTQIPFFTYGRKAKYYNLATDDTVEIGTNLLPVAANGDDVSIFPYQNLAGSFVYLSSINSSVYKIPVANPGNAVDQLMTTYKGFIKFGQSRSILFNRKGSNGIRDVSGLYMSWVDAASLNNSPPFTLTSGELLGASGATHYTATLATITGVRTAAQVTIYMSGVPAANFVGTGINDLTTGGTDTTLGIHVYSVLIDGTGTPDTFKWNIDGGTFTTGVQITGAFQNLTNGVTIKFNATTGHTLNDRWNINTVIPETFVDDQNGNLTSTLGGTGTVNYATGAIDVNFSTLTTRSVYANYYYEDATSHGVLDYSFNSSSRVAGTGRYYSQFDGGGNLNGVFPLANVFYAFHVLKTWQTTVPTDDSDSGSTPSTNLPFREKMGISYPYSGYGGTTGIYYINNSNPNKPEVFELQLFTGATAANIAHPTLISKALDLSPYQFDKALVFEWGTYVCLCMQQIRNGTVDLFNSRMFLYNKKTGVWDLLDYPASRLSEFNGTLISGDPLSNNIFTLFSGFDDDGSLIPNYWTSGYTNHGVPGQKVHNIMVLDGLIQAAQKIKVSLAFDGGDFVEVGGKDTVVNGVTTHTYAIEGTGSYVDTSKSIAVGSNVDGSKIVGGGGSAQVFANPFQREFNVSTQRYEYVRIKLEAVGGGYVQINYYKFKDIRYKGSHSMPVRTT